MVISAHRVTREREVDMRVLQLGTDGEENVVVLMVVARSEGVCVTSSSVAQTPEAQTYGGDGNTASTA
jgi:hypothetical protein